MKQTARVVTLLSLSAATLLASGYRIPEQSLNSVALSAAYVAGANGGARGEECQRRDGLGGIAFIVPDLVFLAHER